MTVQVRGRMLARLVAAGAVGAVALGALGACSGRPGAAAVVDGRAISTRDLNTVLTELAPYFQGASTANVLTVLVQEQTVIDFASQKGVGVSEAQGKQLLHDLATQTDPDAHPTFSPASIEVARYSTAAQNIQALPDADAASAELAKRLAALRVTVNPRFGTIQADTNSVTDPTPLPWLVSSRPAAAPDASPAPDATPSPTPSS